ncbi:MAG TPA: peptidylprolyl isomerase [Burkholderiales bacterium]|nr:peptidylprolyl isomerase [Burkholderiales bacterium]
MNRKCAQLNTSLCIAALAAASLIAHPATAQVPDGAVATVNGVAISQAKFDVVLKDNLSRGQKDTPELRGAIKQALISDELLHQAAVADGLDKDPDTKVRMDLARERELAQAFVRKYLIGKQPTEDDLKAEYEKIKANAPTREYHVRHILVKSEDEAKAIITQLVKGARFEVLASEKSEDLGSKAGGGDLGWQSPVTLVKPFAEAMVKLKKGQYTNAPVQSNFGWHVIKLEDERAPQIIPYEQARPRLVQARVQQLIGQEVAELRKTAKITE